MAMDVREDVQTQRGHTGHRISPWLPSAVWKFVIRSSWDRIRFESARAAPGFKCQCSTQLKLLSTGPGKTDSIASLAAHSQSCVHR
jgi:hypothetical protein